MEREEMEAKAKALGVSFNSRTSDQVLAARLDVADGELEAVSFNPAGDNSADDSPVICRVLMRNLWTSAGKYFAGDDVALPRDEADALEKADKVVIK